MMIKFSYVYPLTEIMNKTMRSSLVLNSVSCRVVPWVRFPSRLVNLGHSCRMWCFLSVLHGYRWHFLCLWYLFSAAVGTLIIVSTVEGTGNKERDSIEDTDSDWKNKREYQSECCLPHLQQKKRNWLQTTRKKRIMYYQSQGWTSRLDEVETSMIF